MIEIVLRTVTKALAGIANAIGMTAMLLAVVMNVMAMTTNTMALMGKVFLVNLKAIGLGGNAMPAL